MHVRQQALYVFWQRHLISRQATRSIEGLRATGRVASYMQAQPVGSAVNNSNSGALMLGRGYDALRSVAGKSARSAPRNR